MKHTNSFYRQLVNELLETDSSSIDNWFCVADCNKPDGIFTNSNEMQSYLQKYSHPTQKASHNI